ncbi:MAG: hypothetical protein WD267_06560 [Balneolales bacterium]
MKVLKSCLTISFFSFWGFCTLQAQDITFDLENAEFNGSEICGFPLNSLTNILGRPDAIVDSGYIRQELGPEIIYHRYGINFRAKLIEDDPNKGIHSVIVYLSRSWDEDHNNHYIAYSGIIIPDLNANNKAIEIEEKFSDNIAVTISAEENRKKREEWLEIGLEPLESMYFHVIKTDHHKHSLFFYFESVTKFLERIYIECH